MAVDHRLDGQLHLRERHTFTEVLLRVSARELAYEFGVTGLRECLLACHAADR